MYLELCISLHYRETGNEEAEVEEAKITLEDEISRQTPVKMAGKISSAAITLESWGTLKVRVQNMPSYILSKIFLLNLMFP